MRGIEQFLQVDAATLGALKYAGTWNASTNTPTLASGVGVQGQYYVVSVAGSTNLDGETNWGVGDWAVFNGSVWQKVDGGSTGLLTTLTVTGNTFLATTSGDVGIGTTSPTSKLQINDGSANSFRAVNIVASGGDAGVRLQPLSGNVQRIQASSSGLIFFNETAAATRMTLDASGNLGIGTSSPTARLHVVGTTQSVTGSTGIQIYGDGGSGYVNSIGANPLIFQVNTTERMRLDPAGNFLVGTSISPSGSGVRTVTASTSSVYSQWTRTVGVIGGGAIGTSGQNIEFFTHTGTVGSETYTERMRLDSAGNLGLGVTPSALWSTNHRVFDLAGASTAHVVAQANGLSVGGNYYVTSGGIATYQTTGQNATRYWQTTSGQHQWYTAASGTAGTAISFTQAMTLDASGNLGVGVTSPDARLRVNGTAKIGEGAASNTSKLMVNTVSGVAAGIQLFQDGNESWIIQNPASTTALTFANSGTERLRITSGGNFVQAQAAESAQNTSVTLSVANLQAGIITSNAAVTLTLPTGTNLDTYTTGMATNTAFECTFIATTANAITIAANGNTTVGNLTVSGNTSGTFRFRKTAANTFTVYRVA